MREGLITYGEIDDRSVRDVSPDDLRGFERVHLFAGIAGWDIALDMAGWKGPAWTGSCPCQPFSAAGKRMGGADERHLWPAFHRLVSECRPATVFGEQVASSDGRAWLSAVRDDLEAAGYAVGAADLCAAGIGAPHIRQRLFWVAHSADDYRRHLRATRPGGYRPAVAPCDGGTDDALAGRRGAHDGWRDGVEWVRCIDGRSRPTQPGIRVLAHGVPSWRRLMRGFGNAIVPPLAADFVAAFRESTTC